MTLMFRPSTVRFSVIVAALLAAVGSASASGLKSLEPLRPELTQMVSLADPMDSGTGSEADASVRSLLLLRLRFSPMCYQSDLRPSEFKKLLAETDLKPPTLGPAITNRYYTDTFVWLGDGNIGPSARAARANLTYSFPADDTTWGLSGTSRIAPNDLNANLVTTFGDIDHGREYLRAALASWRKYTGLTYTEVADDNTMMTGSSDRVPTRGDIRIGGFQFSLSGPNGLLAYNGFPSSLGISAAVSGGDMAINTSYFNATWFQSTTSDYRRLRNTVAHEHGHGVGCIHSVPCDASKLMEPTIVANFDMLQRDEIRAGQRNYGDRYAGNATLNTAHDFGNLTSPVQRSVIVRDLSTNGFSAATSTNRDYFKFSLGSAQPVNISVTPTGSTSNQGQQTGACAGTLADVDSLTAGNLRVELRDMNDALIVSSPAQDPGTPSLLSFGTLAAGTYAIRVYDTGPNLAANQIVQTYNLVIRVNSTNAPPDPIAGINKRVQAGTAAWFNGSANSRANEASATLLAVGYDWDFDGDGVIDSNDTPQPSFVFPSNGIFPVTLYLTDSLGTTGTDTINVTVYGATTVVSSVSPLSGAPGNTVPVTIIGANFKGVTVASQVTVPGGGVTVNGTPVVNALGTQITGLSFAIAGNAVAGPRNVTISNSDGQGASGTGMALFSVGAPPGPPANDECLGAVSWGSATGAQPFSNVSATRSPSQSFPSTGCPPTDPIENDVWYSWTAPASGTLSVTTNSAAFGFASRVALYRISANCPPTAAAFRCEDFGGTFTLPVTANTLYRFQVGSVVAGATGSAQVILTLAPTIGACCQGNGTCTATADTACNTGVWLSTSMCNPNICPQPSGACCTSAGCSILSQPSCDNIPGIWNGFGSTCGNSGAICCIADFNHSENVTIQDIFDYLDAWFMTTAAADIDESGDVTLQDLFDFLDHWFSGC